MNEAENIFLTHSWESKYKSIGGLGSCGLYKVLFLFSQPLLNDMPHPTTHEAVLESIKLQGIYSLTTFLCCCKTVMLLYCYVNKGQAAWFGLA